MRRLSARLGRSVTMNRMLLASVAALGLMLGLGLGVATPTDAANVVLVHGFLGFGPKELWGVRCDRAVSPNAD